MKMKEKLSAPAWKCKYCTMGGSCLKHSITGAFGHISIACEGKCNDYKERVK